jgi:hypothetical protein
VDFAGRPLGHEGIQLDPIRGVDLIMQAIDSSRPSLFSPEDSCAVAVQRTVSMGTTASGFTV